MKKQELESSILSIFEQNQAVSLRDICKLLGLADLVKNRRSIQRALRSLIQQEKLEAKGVARARVYIKKDKFTADEYIFSDISLSKSSTHLLEYITKPVRMRDPVAYNKNFLQTYKPNQSYYLDAGLRDELSGIAHAEHMIRPAGTYARSILNRLLIDLSWNSSRLEGNTYSLLETKRLIELGQNAEGKDLVEAQMILNHKEAIEYIIETVNDKSTTAHTICSIHALLSDNLLGDSSASGRLRNIIVSISGTTYLPLENPHEIRECFELFIYKLNAIEDPFEQSFFSLVHLSYLQAFEDINKRTARLVANIPFIKKNLKPLCFTAVRQQDYVAALLGIYEKNDVSLLRDLYSWAYKRSALQYTATQQVMGEPNIFKLKHRGIIQEMIRKIILDKITDNLLNISLKKMIQSYSLSQEDAEQLFQIIEYEIINLHEGNIARFKIRPSEFEAWKSKTNDV